MWVILDYRKYMGTLCLILFSEVKITRSYSTLYYPMDYTSSKALCLNSPAGGANRWTIISFSRNLPPEGWDSYTYTSRAVCFLHRHRNLNYFLTKVEKGILQRCRDEKEDKLWKDSFIWNLFSYVSQLGKLIERKTNIQ